MPANASSYIPTSGAVLTRNADILPMPFPARPQAMTIYVRFVELGSLIAGGTSVLFFISGAGTGQPNLGMFEVGGVYSFRSRVPSGDAQVSHAVAPSIGDMVEIVGQLNADGSVKSIQSINSGTAVETSTSSPFALPAAWSGQILWIGGVFGLLVGFNAFRNLVIHRGVQSLATMRRLANVR